MNTKAVVAIGVGVVAGIVGAVYLKRFLDREMPEVAQFPDNEPPTQLPDNEVTRGIDQDLKEYWTKGPGSDPIFRRRERPQRHQDTVADAT
jgi:hypothetical protein